MNTLRAIRIAAFLAIGVLVALMAYLTLFNTPKNGIADFGGPFQLQASSGGTLDRAQLLGKPYAMFFGYTNCPDFCPTTMQDMTLLLKTVGEPAKDFRIYFISIDPVRDTAELLKLYLSAFDPRLIGLTGTEAEIAAVIKSFNVYAKKNGSGDTYTFDHTSSVLLFDKAGKLAGSLNSNESEKDQKAKLERLLRG